MAERGRGRGRARGPFRGGRGNTGPDRRTFDDKRDVPWKLVLGYRRLQELKDKTPQDVALTLGKYRNALKEALNQGEHDANLTALFLRCITKATECDSLKETIIQVFVILEDSKFFKMSLSFYIMSAMNETSPQKQAAYKEPFRDLMTIVKEFRLKMPQSIVSIMGLNAILGQTFTSLRETSSEAIDDELWDMYQDYKESQEQALKRQVKKRAEKNTRPEIDNEEDPPDDFRELKIFPDSTDMQIESKPFLRRNKATGGYENLDHYLDVQFRLLREDFIGPLREGIKEYIETIHTTGRASKRLQELRIYTNVQIISPVCNNSGLCRRVSFDCKGMKRIRWESSRRLIFGSLVCLSSDNFQTLLFATVAERDLKSIRKGLIDLKFEASNRIVSNIPKDTVFVMAETTAYFEAYRHVLQGLQNVHEGDMPFEKYIVRCDSEMSLPAYLRQNPTARFDLRPLVDDEIILRGRKNIPGNREENAREITYNFSPKSAEARRVKVNDLKTWPVADLFHLDMSQYRAVQNALSREFAIIQGPPGTGKTYIGLKVVKALLHNRSLWNMDRAQGVEDNRPLLVVCYTNHALDQFLEGILSFFKGDILRLGSRSSSELMKQLNINNMRMTMRKRREVPREVHLARMRTKHEMKALQDEINKISERMEMAKRELLHEDTLQLVMGNFYSRLVSGFEFRVREIMRYEFDWNKKKHQSAIVEWLGYGDMLIVGNDQDMIGNENQNQMNEQQNEDQNAENENEEEPDQLMDEFINVIDELDAEMNMRQLDVDDLDIEEDEEPLVAMLREQVQNIDLGTQRPIVALDVSNLDTEDKTPMAGQWQMTKEQKKRMKKTLRKELASHDRMTEEEVSRVSRRFDMWTLSKKNKWRLYRYWVNAFCDNLQEKIRGKENQFQTACNEYNEVLMQEDREIMRHSTVIGLTTTCAARYQSVLQDIGPRIIVVEEAAEVLEAHIVTTLSRRCEHLILIGDHQQLKPNPTVYQLATKFNLELSLFERMIDNNLEYDCLQFQHRMRPDISLMMKKIYPELRDDDVVKGYEDVKGIANNVFFIDHKNPESNDEDLKSHSNEHEAEFVVALCRYLILQGYDREQITVLTLYSGQLFALRKKMPKTFFEGVRVTVVDNFQGEENDIIILSLVRSNEDGKIGFLSKDNRVCVALSRAKMGMYVIGNFSLLSDKSKLWCSIINHTRRHQFLGDALPLYCQNHPNDAMIMASESSDFKKAPEGGCMKACEFRLPCGHTCARACHTYDRDHQEYECNKACTKTICQNGHRCKKRCNQECGKCHEMVEKYLPKCGHKQYVPCYVDPANWRCTAKCPDRLSCGHPCTNLCGEGHTERCGVKVSIAWDCGHMANISCFLRDTARCTIECKEVLECGDVCKGTCGECCQKRLHISCTQLCQRPLVCEHPCKDRCSNCPPCTRSCENRCKHSYCGKKCGEICVPCAELCEWQCRHYTCDRICSEPCNRPRCNKPCKKALPCGHMCIGLCGEPCPTACKICNHDIVSEIFFGTEDENARYVELEDCGHVFEYTGLDYWMDSNPNEGKDSAVKLKECPRCKKAIRRNLRYGTLIKQTLRDIEAVKMRMLGNERNKRELKRTIELEMRTLPLKIARKVTAYYENLLKEPYNDNALQAVRNQITALKRLDELKEKIIKDQSESLNTDAYTSVLRSLEDCFDFVLRYRKYFTQQETNDLNAELERFRLLLLFLKYKERIRRADKQLPRDIGYDVLKVQQYLTKGPFKLERTEFITTTFKKIKDCLTLPGLGITEEERVEIVSAMGLGKGHWFKCPNGHVYAIGDCGGATMESKCSECGAAIGGSQHRLRGDNQFAPVMDNAAFPAWSEQAHLGNYDPFDIQFE